jgi:hypothetical protein
MKRCLIVTGMHRSGTSFLASFLKEAGADLGSDLFPADYYNPRGYFEDNEFLELDTEILHACVPSETSGFRDWGWPENEHLDRSRLGEFTGRAAELVARRSGASAVWGWKDPRTSLLLDFWSDLVPEARFVFVYRSPWDVMRSAARLVGTYFEARPDRGLSAWQFYNRHLLEFYRKRRDRCVLLPIDALRASPDALLVLVSTKLGIELPRLTGGPEVLAQVEDPALMTRLDGRPGLSSVMARAFPVEARIWSELEEAADLTAGRPALIASAAAGAALRRWEGRPPVLSVVIGCRDEGGALLEALAGLEASEPLCEPIVVDDRSTEPYTVEVLSRLGKAGVTVARGEGEGRGAVRNAGIAAARAPLVLIFDRPEPIAPPLAARVAAVFADRSRVGFACGDPAAVASTERGPIPDLAALAGGHGDPAASCFALRRSVWEQCGGFDDTLAAGYEDWDFRLSAIERGWTVILLPELASRRPPSLDADPRSPQTLLDHRLLIERLVARHPLPLDARLPGLLVQAETRRLEEAELGLQEAERLRSSLRSSLQELERWRERVAFMQGTRAWRARERLLRLRRLFRRRSS